MTLPKERGNSLKNVYAFLSRLLDPKQTKRVPKQIRRDAYYCIKHFPSPSHINELIKRCPDLLGEDDE